MKLEGDLSGFCTGYHSADGISWVMVGESNFVAMEGPLHVGLAVTSHNANYFDGQIDDIRIYNRALTEEEIAAVMTGGHVIDMYHPVESPMNLVDPEQAGSRAVNFADLAVFVDNWGERQLWS